MSARTHENAAFDKLQAAAEAAAAIPDAVYETRAALAPAKVVEVTLANPIQRQSGPLAQITLRKPSAGDLRGLSLQALLSSDVGAIITVLPRISSPFITEHEAAALEADDLAEIGGALLGFFMSPAQRAQIAQMTGA